MSSPSSPEGQADRLRTRRIAAALEYEPDGISAPRLIAKGHGKVAESILAVARERGILVEDNPAMAEALVKLDLLQEIPAELYEAVAEMIAFMYRVSVVDGSTHVHPSVARQE